MHTRSLTDYPLAELKMIYTLLQTQIALHPALMDSELLADLQTFLQQQAGKAGVDVSLHSQWQAWLHDTGKPQGVAP